MLVGDLPPACLPLPCNPRRTVESGTVFAKTSSTTNEKQVLNYAINVETGQPTSVTLIFLPGMFGQKSVQLIGKRLAVFLFEGGWAASFHTSTP